MSRLKLGLLLLGLSLLGGVALVATELGPRDPAKRRSESSIASARVGEGDPQGAGIETRSARQSEREGRSGAEREVRSAAEREEGEAEQAAEQVEDPRVVQRRERQRRRLLGGARAASDELARALDLSRPQLLQVRELMNQHVNDVVEMRERARRDGENYRSLYNRARDALQARIDEVLTPEQRQAADDLRDRGGFPDIWPRRSR